MVARLVATLGVVLGLSSLCLRGSSPPTPPTPSVPPAVSVPAIAPPPPPVPAPPPPPSYVRVGDDPVVPLAGLPAPSIEGEKYEPVTGVPWETFRALLAATRAISNGTRIGYRALGDYTDALRTAPRVFRHGGVHAEARPGWWRPAPGVVVLVVPYFLIGNNGGPSLAFFGPADGGGVRHAYHVHEWSEGACPPVEAVAITDADDEWRFLNGCDEEDAGATFITVKWSDGRLDTEERTIDPTR